jgi:hypothetical protein
MTYILVVKGIMCKCCNSTVKEVIYSFVVSRPFSFLPSRNSSTLILSLYSPLSLQLYTPYVLPSSVFLHYTGSARRGSGHRRGVGYDLRDEFGPKSSHRTTGRRWLSTLSAAVCLLNSPCNHSLFSLPLASMKELEEFEI